MNYLIHHTAKVLDEKDRSRAELLIEEHMQGIKKLIRNGLRPVAVDIYFSRTAPQTLVISSVVNLNGEIIYIKEKGQVLEAVLRCLFDRVKLAIVKENYRRKKYSALVMKERQLEALSTYVSDLQEMKKHKTQDVFYRLLKDLLKEVAKYIKRRIKAAEMTSAVKKGKFKVQELLDELYLMVYDRVENMPQTASATNHWLYQLADELLEKLFKELEFEKDHFKNLESLVESEYQLMKEEFTVNAEEEIIPMEELEEYQKTPDWYAADDLIYGEDEDSLLDDITLRLNQKEIHDLIEKELSKYPTSKRTIMDLYLIGQLSIDEISEAKWIERSEVEKIIQEVNRDLKKKLAVYL